jgi:hypothetical protein
MMPLLTRLNNDITTLTSLSTDAQSAMSDWVSRIQAFEIQNSVVSQAILDVEPPDCLLNAHTKITTVTLNVGVATLEMDTIAESRSGGLPALRTRIAQFPRALADATAAIDSAACS